MAARVRDSGASLCLVALGAPKQELLADALAAALPVRRLPVRRRGARFHRRTRPPRADLDAANGLEWLWRLAVEPRRLAGRYLARAYACCCSPSASRSCRSRSAGERARARRPADCAIAARLRLRLARLARRRGRRPQRARRRVRRRRQLVRRRSGLWRGRSRSAARPLSARPPRPRHRRHQGRHGAAAPPRRAEARLCARPAARRARRARCASSFRSVACDPQPPSAADGRADRALDRRIARPASASTRSTFTRCTIPTPADVARDDVRAALARVLSRGQARAVAVAGSLDACRAAIGGRRALCRAADQRRRSRRRRRRVAGRRAAAGQPFGVRRRRRRARSAARADSPPRPNSHSRGWSPPAIEPTAAAPPPNCCSTARWPAIPSGVVLASMFDADHRAADLARARRRVGAAALGLLDEALV